MAVTFTSRRIDSFTDEYRCNETGVCYRIERVDQGYVIRNSGNVVAHRSDRALAMTYIEQEAELDFRVAQADSTFPTEGSC